jgi:inosine-uridine nucleoside N-ribohydrolase
VRLWVDTDVGTDPDDAVALRCAQAHPDVELVGVSTVDDANGARATLATQLVGEVPVTIGQLLDPDGFAECEPDAVLAIGPLTNIARLLDAGVTMPRLAVMGGVVVSVQHRGALCTVEHNFGSDPAAAGAVLDRASNALVCPLDVTVRTCVDDEVAGRFVAAEAAFGPMLDSWGQPLCLHDPLALLALLGEPVVQVERRQLGVGADGVVHVGEGAEHDVVVEVDAPAAIERIVTLFEGARRYT